MNTRILILLVVLLIILLNIRVTLFEDFSGFVLFGDERIVEFCLPAFGICE